MERLEAALDKARETRRALNTQTKPTDRGAGSDDTHEPAELWHRLQEFRISSHSARKHRISTMNPTKGSGPYDLLRSRMMRLMQDNDWKTVAVTSPNSACGKTTVCANLAFGLARQHEIKVMVLDLDLRRPALHKVLSQKPSDSFHEVLEGKVRTEDQLVRYGDNLAIGMNVKPSIRPSELLQSTATAKKLEQIVAAYQPDFVIYDMPPMLASDDNVGFLPNVDCAMLVNAAESTTMAQLDNCEKELAGLTNVLGVVLNKCRFHDADTGYDSDYYY